MDKFIKGFSRDDDYTSQFDYDSAQNHCFDKLKELIDNQLTVEELDWIIVKANFIRTASMNSNTQNICESICEKLKKQKEMWEEE